MRVSCVTHCLLLSVLVVLCLVPTPQAQVVGLEDPCRHTKANELGVARADIPLDTTAIQVVPTSVRLCGAIILNTSTTQAARCAGVNDGLPTATAGFRLGPGLALILTLEAQDGIFCIRDTTATASTSVTVFTLYP
jgi:hypothetical protein